VIRRFFVFLFLLVPLVVLWSQRGEFTLSEVSGDDAGYAPGTVVVRPVRIAYQGVGKAVVTYHLLLPDSWRFLSGHEDITLEQEGSEVLLIGFHLPRNAGAGEYRVTLILREGEEEVSRLELPVLVLPQPKLFCLLIEQPDYILAGAAYRVVFGCSNTGNVPLTAAVDVYSSSGFDARAEVSRLQLRPGETVRMSVIVDTPINLYAQLKHILRLELYAENDVSVKASASSLVDIIPRTTGKEYRYNTILGEIYGKGVFQHGEEGDLFGLESGVSGQGFLDEDNRTFLLFRLLGPLAGTGTLIRDREEYLLKVTGPGYSAGIGKQFYSLSPLTEVSRQGTGASLSMEYGDFSLGGFAFDNLLELQREDRFGAKMSYRFGDRGMTALNILEGRDEDGWSSGSLEGHFLLPSGNRLEWEYASSATGGRTDDALYTSLGGSSNDLSYHLKYLRAGPWYRGSVEDVEQFIVSLNYVPEGPVRLRALLGRKDYNIDREIPDTLRSSLFGISWTGFSSTLFTADVLRTFEDTRNSLSPVRLERESYRLGFVRDTPAADFKMSYEFGCALEGNSASRSFSERITARMDVSTALLGDLWTSIGYCFRNYDDTRAPYSDVILAWEKELSGRIGLSAIYRTVNSRRSYYVGSDNLALSLDIAFPSQSDMIVTAEYGPDRNSGSPEDVKVTVEFSSPFPIPVSIKKNIGKIEGKVTDAESGAAVPDVVLRLGERVAATDSFGRYAFHSLAPGTYRLYIDPASLPDNYVPAESMPLEVTVSDTLAEENIRITRAAYVSGRVVLYRFDRNYRWLGGEKGAAYVDPEGISGVLLTLESPQGVVRALTGEEGDFVFPPLRPDTWVLNVPPNIVPDAHFPAKDRYEIVLEPGGREDISIKIFPKVRQIKFIDEGTVIEETPPERGPQPDTAE